MIIIRSLQDISHEDIPVSSQYRLTARYLQSYPDQHSDEDGLFIYLQPEDTLTSLREFIPFNPNSLPEYFDIHDDYSEVLYLMGDSGYGVCLIIPSASHLSIINHLAYVQSQLKEIQL